MTPAADPATTTPIRMVVTTTRTTMAVPTTLVLRGLPLTLRPVVAPALLPKSEKAPCLIFLWTFTHVTQDDFCAYFCIHSELGNESLSSLTH